jgi:hypothetical protein
MTAAQTPDPAEPIDPQLVAARQTVRAAVIDGEG